MLRVALALDLDDLTGMTGAGLHMANLGGAWQAVASGFAGVRVRAGVLTVDPRLPGAWDGLQLRFRCLGRKVRLDITRRVASAAEINMAVFRSNAIQEALWQQAKEVAAQDSGMVPTGIFILTLNEMIDNQEKRLTAGRNQVPNIALLALYAIALVAISFTGYAGAREARRWRPGVYITGILIAAIILLIQDLDRPNSGFVTVSQQPMIDVGASLADYSD